MTNFLVYKNEDENVLVEVLNQTANDVQDAEKWLLDNKFIITSVWQVKDLFLIKAYKVKEWNND